MGSESFTRSWADRIEALIALAMSRASRSTVLLGGAQTFMLASSTSPSANPTFSTPAVTLPAGATRWLVMCTASFAIDGPNAPRDRFHYFLFRDTSATPIGPAALPITFGQLPSGPNGNFASTSLITIDEGPIAAGSHTYGLAAQDDDSGSGLFLEGQGTSITLVPLL